MIVDVTLRGLGVGMDDRPLLPGGSAHGKWLHDEYGEQIARRWLKSDEPLAANCRGPQILLSARLAEGRRVACRRSAAQQLANGGALHEYNGVAVGGNLTGRQWCHPDKSGGRNGSPSPAVLWISSAAC